MPSDLLDYFFHHRLRQYLIVWYLDIFILMHSMYVINFNAYITHLNIATNKGVLSALSSDRVWRGVGLLHDLMYVVLPYILCKKLFLRLRPQDHKTSTLPLLQTLACNECRQKFDWHPGIKNFKSKLIKQALQNMDDINNWTYDGIVFDIIYVLYS